VSKEVSTRETGLYAWERWIFEEKFLENLFAGVLALKRLY